MMCTAVFMKNEGLFGRTLDLEYTFGEAVTITPKGFKIDLRAEPHFTSKYIIIGMSKVVEDFPLYFDAVNEKGLAIAGLNFPRSARYSEIRNGALNLASFEIIPYILGNFKDISEATSHLERLNITGTSFSEKFPATPLHWMLADKETSVVLESTESGLKIYENPIGVMTNEPPFPFQKTYLENFSHLTSEEDDSRYSRGLSAFSLPGDFSSLSRFVRGAFLLKNSLSECGKVTEFFKITDNVSVPRGAVRLKNGKEVITQYACCMDIKNGMYYYKTYGNSRICGVSIERAKDAELNVFHPRHVEDIIYK